MSPLHATCPVHLILLDLITRMIFDEHYRPFSSLLYSFLHSPVTLSLLGPNILLSTLFSNALSLRSALNVVLCNITFVKAPPWRWPHTWPKHVEAYNVCSLINSHIFICTCWFYSHNESTVHGQALLKNFTLLIYGDYIYVIRHSYLPHALPAAGIVTRTAHQFLRSSSATYVHSITASLASLSNSTVLCTKLVVAGFCKMSSFPA
jgi:hypothetical protein